MTNETLHTLETRRSCRAYKPEQITKEELEAVLRAGTFAPSAMNRQSAKIVVVQDAETHAQLTRMNAAVMGNTGDPMYGAPTILVVLADANARCGVQDGSLVMGNLMNAAAAIGLGSCWINRAKEEFETEEGKALLKKWGIEGDYIGVGHCILGYPAEEPRPAAPRKRDSRRFQALSRRFSRRPHRSGRGFAVFVQKKKHPRSFPSRFLQISGKKHRCFLAICRSL